MIDHLEYSSRAAHHLARDGATIRWMTAISELLTEALKRDQRIYTVGNGGSAADAQHIAAEFIGRFQDKHPGRIPLPAISLCTDSSVLTALANDYSFDRVYRKQIDALGKPGDVLWALSTSGNSPNIVEAAVAARELGMHVVGFTGLRPSRLSAASTICLRAPSDDTAIVQQCHMIAYHAIIGDIEANLAYLWKGEEGA